MCIGTCHDDSEGGGYTCSCSTGYELHSDGFTCVDWDACTEQPCGEGNCLILVPEKPYDHATNILTTLLKGGHCSDDAAPSEGYACSCDPGLEVNDEQHLSDIPISS